MIRYLLDTNCLSELMKDPLGRVGQHVALLSEADFCTSIVVAAELRFGAEKSRSVTLARQVQAILSKVQVVAWASPADKAYGILRASLDAAGTPIGANDMLIAAHALALDCILVTDNETEFRRVPGLIVENWLRSA